MASQWLLLRSSTTTILGSPDQGGGASSPELQIPQGNVNILCFFLSIRGKSAGLQICWENHVLKNNTRDHHELFGCGLDLTVQSSELVCSL